MLLPFYNHNVFHRFRLVYISRMNMYQMLFFVFVDDFELRLVC